ncbi:MAG: glycosyltransferase [Candidatus Lokiarchaeota archaeon]|nr:glycosyltransferase [Candidatus Lokiarchaeota archaeon]MBD3201248.1 glycosyltransferase [Candidatus Lokiarchaeota archaeon]
MNIIYIVNFHIYKNLKSLPTVGGIEVTTMDIIDELRNRGHNLWVPSEQKRPKWVEDGEVDIICSSSFDPLTFLQVLIYKNKFSDNAAIVQHAHTTYEDLKGNILPDSKLFNLILKSWIRLLYSQAHLLITPSDYARECLEKVQKTRTYPILSVSSGIIIDKFEKKKNYRPKFRKYLQKRHGVPLDATVVLNVGLTWKRKRIDIFGKVANYFPDLHFVWVGPIKENPDVRDTSELDNVIFTGFYDDIREPYYGSDLLFVPSVEENLCLPLIEASLCKLPIVARDIPAFSWLKHNISVYKGNSVDEFVEGIKKIIENKDYKENLVNNACEIAKEKHDFSETVDKIEGYFKKAIIIKNIWNNRR